MAEVSIASFNVWGIDGKDVKPAIDCALTKAGPSLPTIVAIGFQDVWFEHQLAHVLSGWVAGGGTTTTQFVGLDCRSSAGAPGWKCLVPNVGSAGIPGVKSLELGSGLALCVRGSIRDAFFSKFTGGYTPDSFAKKRMIAVHFAPPGLAPRAIICTHFHDFCNDKFGVARRNNLQQRLISTFCQPR